MLSSLASCGMPARKLLPAVPAATLDLVRACEDERGVDVSGMPREERRALQSLYCASASYNQQFETYDEELDLAQFSDWLRALGGRHIARWRARARRMRTRGRARARRSMTMTATTAMTAGESNVAQRLYSVLCLRVCARGAPPDERPPLRSPGLPRCPASGRSGALPSVGD